jgi:hypothetical protein
MNKQIRHLPVNISFEEERIKLIVERIVFRRINKITKEYLKNITIFNQLKESIKDDIKRGL